MKKIILLLGAILYANILFAKFLTTGTITTDNKYRSGGLGIGYVTAPAFSVNKFMVNGNATFSGNVGVGTVAPTAKLHVPTGIVKIDDGSLEIGNPPAHWTDASSNWGIKSARSIMVRNFDIYNEIAVHGNGGSIQMAVANCIGCYSNNAKIGDAVLRGLTSGSLIISNEQTGDIRFETTATPYPAINSQTRVLIDKTGCVGIGTGNAILNPLEKLAVNGLIHTKEVKVDLLNWPDFVFEKNYNLPSLKFVENQIRTKGHLSNIPSAE